MAGAYTNTIADLILRQGDIRAQQAQNRGQLWGGVAQSLGQVPGQIGQLRAQQAQVAASAEDRDLARRAKESQLATEAVQRQNIGSQIDERDATRANEVEARALAAQTAKVNGWLLSIAGAAPGEQEGLYAAGRAQLIADGALTQEDAPSRYLGPSWVKSRLAQTLPAVERFKALFPEPEKPPALMQRDPTRDLVHPVTGAVVTPGVPAVVPPKTYPVTVPGPGNTPVHKLATEEEMRAGVPGYVAPREGAQPSYQWAKDPTTGVVRRMTEDEIRASGAGQPDTADMRNKEAGKRTALRAVAAVRALGSRIITRVGPAQRAAAIERGVEAVFGTDPDFRTYQDARMALAGTLAVEQQGSRVSDADVKALWLPMVPDAYRDTRESNDLKWSLIDSMRGVEAPSKPARPRPGALPAGQTPAPNVPRGTAPSKADPLNLGI